MSLLTLHNSEYLTLLSDQTIYSREDMGALGTVLDKVSELEDTLASARDRVSKAAKQASQEAYQEGLKRGKAEGHEEAMREVLQRHFNKHDQVTATNDELRVSAVELALDVVRRIGLEVGEADSLRMLAEKAVKTLRPDEQVIVKVHPENEEVMRLLSTRSEVTVATDDSLSVEKCVLEWRDGGSVEVDLQSQLEVIKEFLLRTIKDQ